MSTTITAQKDVSRAGHEGYSSHGMAAYRAPSLLQPHRARQAIADAHAGRIPPLIGFYCSWGSPPAAKVAAQLGYDFVWVDWEHAAMSVETMTQMVHDIQHISEGRSAAIVRVPGHDHASIGFALDAGASIVIPQVDTVEQAQHIVSAAKFGAKIKGKRSAPPGRWLPGLSSMACHNEELTFWENLNKQAAIIIETESLEGIQNLDAILTAVGEHIDSVWLGSLDCRASMSLPGFAGDEPEWLAAVEMFRSVLKKHNMPFSGLALSGMGDQKAAGEGMSLMFPLSDLFAVLGTTAALQATREMFPVKDFSTN